MSSEFESIYKLQTKTIVMINNRIKQAKYQLSQHRTAGTNSRLSVFEVAKLMDTVKNGDDSNQFKSHSLFFSLN